MPADQRPPTAGHLTGWRPGVGPDLGDTLDDLASGDLVVEGRLPWSSNLTFLVSVGDGNSVGDGGPLQAVYKPARGEQPLWDFPDGLFRRETVAYVLSEALGWGLVPPTVTRPDGPFGEGSVQLFVEADYEQHYFTLVDKGGFDADLQAICAFDVVANNADRKSGHVLAGTGGRLWAIDHGLCFHDLPKLRTVIWDFAGEEVPESLMADLDGLAADLPDSLAGLLTRPERASLVDRIRALLDAGVFPEPSSDRPYPWPLI